MQAILYFENGCLRMTLNFLTSLFWECLYIGWECLYTGLVSVHWLSVCTLADQRKSRQWRHEFKLSRLKKVVLHGLTCLQSIISTSETPYEGGDWQKSSCTVWPKKVKGMTSLRGPSCLDCGHSHFYEPLTLETNICSIPLNCSITHRWLHILPQHVHLQKCLNLARFVVSLN